VVSILEKFVKVEKKIEAIVGCDLEKNKRCEMSGSKKMVRGERVEWKGVM
jgi:hypothetical protein